MEIVSLKRSFEYLVCENFFPSPKLGAKFPPVLPTDNVRPVYSLQPVLTVQKFEHSVLLLDLNHGPLRRQFSPVASGLKSTDQGWRSLSLTTCNSKCHSLTGYTTNMIIPLHLLSPSTGVLSNGGIWRGVNGKTPRYGRRRERRWTPTRAKAQLQDTRATCSPNIAWKLTQWGSEGTLDTNWHWPMEQWMDGPLLYRWLQANSDKIILDDMSAILWE